MEKEFNMGEKNRKIITGSMIRYELRNVTGNPFVHIFGIGMPVLMAVLITRVYVAEISDDFIVKMSSTTIFLGIGALIPMATILIGYAVVLAQDLEKGIPQRLQLFGIKSSVTIVNRAVSELIFMMLAYFIYFLVGIFALDLEPPTVSGFLLYVICILVFSITCFMMAHGIASLTKKFGLTYCVVMLIYFVFMIFGGSMGISYENMSAWMQAVAKLLPVTYFNRDFFDIWTGERYDFVPMIQSYLFFGAVGGILLFIAQKRNSR
ncbi:MAG: ABC transporter permease [Roseburia sp.]|nr:ABC transporter permease [Roseburia sp.]